MKTGRSLTDLAAEIERQAKSKKDYVSNLEAVTMLAPDEVPRLAIDGVDQFDVTATAHNQIAEHVKIDRRYYDRMRREAPQLLATNVNHWFRANPAPRMLRTLDGKVRAMLSSSYQRLDNEDFAAATLPILSARNLTVMSCEITESRLYIKAVDEKLYRDVPVGYRMGDGSHKIFDTNAPAVILSNSEIGFGRLVVETGVYTQACTNLALFAGAGVKRTHVGARHHLADGMDVAELDRVLTDATKRKTMEALWMQVRDVIASAFDAAAFERRCEALEVAAGRRITGRIDKVMELTQERYGLSVPEKDSVLRYLIEGGSLSQYGLQAAITRTAHDAESYDRATELEYVGGRVIELAPTEWQAMAEAA